MKRIVLSALFVFVLFAGSAYADSVSDAVTLSGMIQNPGEWNADRLKKEVSADVTTISYSSHGQKHASTAVPLLSLLKASGLQTKLKSDPKADPKTKHFELRYAVVVQGRDGYVAIFSLAELQLDLGGRHVWLALDMDGQPLAAADGPMKLIASDDEKPARWVHAVQSICVVNVAQPTTQPEN